MNVNKRPRHTDMKLAEAQWWTHTHLFAPKEDTDRILTKICTKSHNSTSSRNNQVQKARVLLLHRNLITVANIFDSLHKNTL